jgi:Flp pilus assembly protein TadB
VSDWTIETLKEMLDERYATQVKALDAAFKAQEAAVAAALQAAEKATVKAEAANEKRFESVNEFRAQLTDQAGTFVSRREHEAKLDALGAKLTDAVARLDQSQGRSAGVGVSAQWVYMIIIVVGVIAGVVGSRI